MESEYAKKVLFDETLKALEALGKQSRKYGVGEVCNWCRFVLGEKPQGFTPAEKLAAAFFLDNAIKIERGFVSAGAATITGHPNAIAHLEKEQRDFDRIKKLIASDDLKPKATYRLDEQIRWKLIRARVMEERDG